MPSGRDRPERNGSLAATKAQGAALACIATLIACGPRAASPAEALAMVEARLPAFDEFDGWARRTLEADPERPGSDAFRELLFSPLQDDESVVAAWVVREGASPRAWEMRDCPSPRLVDGWTQVRHEGLGPIRVGRFAIDDPRTPTSDRVEVVVVERRARSSASAWVEVSVAYAAPAP